MLQLRGWMVVSTDVASGQVPKRFRFDPDAISTMSIYQICHLESAMASYPRIRDKSQCLDLNDPLDELNTAYMHSNSC